MGRVSYLEFLSQLLQGNMVGGKKKKFHENIPSTGISGSESILLIFLFPL